MEISTKRRSYKSEWEMLQEDPPAQQKEQDLRSKTWI